MAQTSKTAVVEHWRNLSDVAAAAADDADRKFSIVGCN